MTLTVELLPAVTPTVTLTQPESNFSVSLSLVQIGQKGETGDANPLTLQAVVDAQAAAAASQAQASASTAKAVESALSATSSETSAASAAASAASAAQIVYGNLIMHPSKITESVNIPDGFNGFLVDPVEIGPNVTITGLGNSTLRGL